MATQPDPSLKVQGAVNRVPTTYVQLTSNQSTQGPHHRVCKKVTVMEKGSIVLGTYTLDNATKFDVPQEYAGASQTIEVPAGVYTITAKRDRYGNRYVCITLPGVLVFSSFYNRIGACGSNRVEHPNTPATHYLTPYAHALAEDLLKDSDNTRIQQHIEQTRQRVHLAEGVTAERIPFEYKGEIRHTYGFALNGEHIDCR